MVLVGAGEGARVVLIVGQRDRLRGRVAEAGEGAGVPFEPVAFFAPSLILASSRQSFFLSWSSVLAVATIAKRGRVAANQWIAAAARPVFPMPWPALTIVRLFLP
jgi:hypothetical protein